MERFSIACMGIVFFLCTSGMSGQSSAGALQPLSREAVTLWSTSAVPANAPQNEDMFKNNTLWAVGFHLGLLSGIGVSGRFHPPGRFAFQLTAGGIGLKDVVTFNSGLEVQFDFDTDRRTRFYGYAAAGYYYWEDKAGVQDIGPFRAGLGVAYEWDISPKLIFMANLGVTYFSTGTVLPIPQAGLYYYFN
ncbi:MAG: hypothetical protein QHI48_02420 [Bacteroidota bacterium]|nr:hypothetical protein [Bacteroidota bacterium]